MDNKYTHPVTVGEKHKIMLPSGVGLVLEGGGTRGFYTAGVFEAFMDEGVMFPYIAGVSAGAANALTYISGQRGRSRMIVQHYAGNHRYVSKRNMFRHGEMFGYDFIFDTIPKKHIFWDAENFNNTDIRFLTGVTDCDTGEAVWFEKSELHGDFSVSRASCAVPLMAKIVRHGERNLLDGGVSAPIPIERSVADGNTFHVIVLTRNEGYVKPPFNHKWLLKAVYGKYPKLIDAIMDRHNVYNRQLTLCERLEREGKAVIIRPKTPLAVERTAANTEKLLALYDDGHREGAEALTEIKRRINNDY